LAAALVDPLEVDFFLAGEFAADPPLGRAVDEAAL
jgi:hypothetical protein